MSTRMKKMRQTKIQLTSDSDSAYSKSQDSETPPHERISSGLVTFADELLSGIPVSDSRTEISAALRIVRGINISNETTRNQLEDCVRYLTELLEPLSNKPALHIPLEIPDRMRKLGVEVHVKALKLKPKPPSKSPCQFFCIPIFWRNPRPTVRESYDLRTFTRDFKSALDQYQTNALPFYPMSPMESTMMLHYPFVLDSSFHFDKFIDWIIHSRQLVDERFGLVQSVHTYRDYADEKDTETWRAVEESIIVGLRNNRGIQNWVRMRVSLGLVDTNTGGGIRFFHPKTVSLATTKEALDRGDYSSGAFVIRIPLSMSVLAEQIKIIADADANAGRVEKNHFPAYLAKLGEYVQNTQLATERVKNLHGFGDSSKLCFSCWSPVRNEHTPGIDPAIGMRRGDTKTRPR